MTPHNQRRSLAPLSMTDSKYVGATHVMKEALLSSIRGCNSSPEHMLTAMLKVSSLRIVTSLEITCISPVG
jgi:hypothetical protein